MLFTKKCQNVNAVWVYFQSDVGSSVKDGGCKNYERSLLEPRQFSQYSYQATRWMTEFDSRQARTFLFATVSIPVLEPTEPTIQWVPGYLIQEQSSSRSVKLTIYSNTVSRLRMHGAIPLLSHTSAWVLSAKDNFHSTFHVSSINCSYTIMSVEQW
jgi:hypothetical protein